MTREQAFREALAEVGVPESDIDRMEAMRDAQIQSLNDGYRIELAGREEISPEEVRACKERIRQLIQRIRAKKK